MSFGFGKVLSSWPSVWFFFFILRRFREMATPNAQLLGYRFEPEFAEDELPSEPTSPVEPELHGDNSQGLLLTSDSSEVREERLGHTRWCKCECCVAMERPEDSLCCAEDMAAGDKKGHLRCICQHEEFDRVCLDRAVLDVALTGYFESRCQPDSRANR